MSPSKFDPRTGPEASELLSAFRGRPHQPLMHLPDLREARMVLDALPELEFPINSGGELVDKLNKARSPLRIAGVTIDPAEMIHRMPSHYFPIASLENFAEKIAELIRKNRKKVDVVKELKRIKTQLPKMRYPIADIDELVRQLGPNKRYKYRRGTVQPQSIRDRIPSDIFPIKSQDDFDDKVRTLMVNQPLIVGHRPGREASREKGSARKTGRTSQRKRR